MSIHIKDDLGGGTEKGSFSVAELIKQLQALGGSLDDAFGGLKAMAQAARQTSTATGKLKRTLLGFDEIYRLKGSSSSAGSQLAETARELGPVSQSLVKLKAAVEPLTRQLFSGLDWAWKDILVPMGQWTPNDALSGDLDELRGAMGAVNTVVEAARSSFSWLWGSFLEPMKTWSGGPVTQGLTTMNQKLTELGTWVRDNQADVGSMVRIQEDAATAAGVLNQSLTALSSPLGLVGDSVARLNSQWSQVGPMASGALQLVQSVWGSMDGWLQAKVLTPTQTGIRGMLNGIIGCFNGALTGTQGAVNRVVQAVNGLGFTLPDWIPLIGGKRLSFDLKTVTLPPIPYLAQGAVLPANKPFLAVVGDQKNGTNVEAPLATIQEAVALVMEDQTAAILAGFETSTQVQREILEAVLGIHIGDQVLAQAVDRYRTKLAVVTGGGL